MSNNKPKCYGMYIKEDKYLCGKCPLRLKNKCKKATELGLRE